MQRFILSAFSVLLATAAIAPTAQALPKTDTDFSLQMLRLSEFDVRNKGEDSQQPYYYPEASTQSSPQTVVTEDESAQMEKPAEWETPIAQEEGSPLELSLIEQRHQSLDRS
ncbi:MAG: hypothetical protein AAF810_16040 [Cyanobacteria bacterium P01_D01_bin.36]